MREVSNVFDVKATRLIRCLLTNVGKKWTVRQLAKEANISVGYSHAILTTLANMKYVKRSENNKLILMNADLLLKRWAAFYQYSYANCFLQFYTFEKEIDSFLKMLAEKLNGYKYALTSLSAAWMISPYVRPVDVHLYVPTKLDAERIAKILDVKPTDGTGNVKMVLPYDEGVFYGVRSVEGIQIVSNVQLFVDLWNYTSRGEDAAKRIYELLEKEWSAALTGVSYVR
jgi:hypothetical protein